MFEQFKSVGGAISAGVAVIAAVITLVKWIQNAGHELPPILLSLGLLAAGLTLATLTVTLAWLALRHRNSAAAATAAGEMLVTIAFVWIAVRVELLTSLFSGEYRAHQDELVSIGVGIWAGAAGLLFTAARAEITARKAPDWAPRGRKFCPECAEYPKRAARVCRHCGHRFAPVAGEP
ncbi:MAG TPA: hypothetical protein VIH49_01680 [Solirubrobacteraceae bacterium]